MSILDELNTNPEKRLTKEEFRQGLTEIGKKFAGTKSKSPLTEKEWQERNAEILKAMNSEKTSATKIGNPNFPLVH